MVPRKRGVLIQQIVGVVEDFDQRAFDGFEMNVLDCPMYLVVTLLLDVNNYLISSPVSGFSFLDGAAFAFTKHGRSNQYAEKQRHAERKKGSRLASCAEMGRSMLRSYKRIEFALCRHGCVMSSGLTRASNSSAVTKPSLMAASRRLMWE